MNSTMGAILEIHGVVNKSPQEIMEIIESLSKSVKTYIKYTLSESGKGDERKRDIVISLQNEKKEIGQYFTEFCEEKELIAKWIGSFQCRSYSLSYYNRGHLE